MNSASSSWSSSYQSLQEMVETVLQLSSERNEAPENGLMVAKSFTAFLEMQIVLVQQLFYQQYPSMGVFFDDLIPIQLPPADSTVALWTRFYKTDNAFTIAEALTDQPKDIVYGRTIPTGIRNFAAEYLLTHSNFGSVSLSWYPAIRLVNINIPPGLHISVGYVFCSRSFAMTHLRPWLGNPKEVEVSLINRKDITRQIEWKIRSHKVYLLIL